MRKFTETRFEIVSLHTASSWNWLKIQDAVDADIVIVVELVRELGVP